MGLLGRYFRVSRVLILGLFVGLVAGCGTSQKTDFYQLYAEANHELTGVEQGVIVGIGPINLPEYIKRPQIISRKSAHSLNVSEFNRWIEPVTDAVTRSLVINLSNELDSNRVFWLPRSDRQYPLELRVAIDIGRFDGEPGKEVTLESRWIVFDKEDNPVQTHISIIHEPVQGKTYEDLVIAMNNALNQLSQEIAQAAKKHLKN